MQEAEAKVRLAVSREWRQVRGKRGREKGDGGRMGKKDEWNGNEREKDIRYGGVDEK